VELREIQLSVLNSLKTGVAPSFINASNKLSGEAQLDIYHSSITAAFDATLETLFPVCKQLVGEEYFLAMGRRFQQQAPSKSPDLNTFAAQFPEFIAAFPPAQALPYLADVAALEWAMQVINVGTDSEDQLDVQALALIPEMQLPSLRFRCRDNLQLLYSEYPVDAIWQAHQQAEVPQVDIAAGPLHCVVWRQAYDCHITPVDRDTFEFLQGCKKQMQLEEILALNAIDLERVLALCVSNAWLINFATQES
jgi:hypothetical protein